MLAPILAAMIAAAPVAQLSSTPPVNMPDVDKREHAPTRFVPIVVAQTATVSEREYNGSRGFADPVVPGSIVGELADAFDLDYYRLTVTAPSRVTATMSASGPTPAQTPTLTLFDADHVEIATAFGRTFASGFPEVEALLAPGTYYFECKTLLPSGGGGYALTIATAAPGAVPVLPVSGMLARNLPASGETFAFQLAVDTNVQVQSGGGALDLYFRLLREGGGTLLEVDDSAAGTDPTLDVDLPAGNYLLTVTENSGTAGPYSLQVSRTPTTIPQLSCGSNVTGSLPELGSLRMHRLTVGSTQSLVLATQGSGMSPMQDGLVTLFDDRLVQIAFADEDPMSSNPTLGFPLPAGNYWVGVQAYDGAPVGFDLDVRCGALPPIVPLVAGPNAGALQNPGDYAAWHWQVATPLPFDVTLRGTGGSPLPDGMLSVVDVQTGRQVDFDDDSFAFDPHVGAHVPPGDYLVVVREYFNGTGTFELSCEPPLRYLDPAATRTLLGLSKEGDLFAAFVSASEIPPTPVAPGVFDGFLQIDLTTTLLAFAQFAPADGRCTGPTLPNGFTYFAQGVVFPEAMFPLNFTNMIR